MEKGGKGSEVRRPTCVFDGQAERLLEGKRAGRRGDEDRQNEFKEAE